MKQVAILGYGKEGRSAAQFYKKRGHKITVIDQFPEKVKDFPVLKEGSDLSNFDFVVRSPSFSPEKITHKDVRSVTNIFFEEFKGKTIAVTGTKGKGTTASLIREILVAAGFKTELVGNIGLPAIDALPKLDQDSIAVYEISSFQLWDIKYSPHVAVVLMIEPDHLDIHDDLDDYVAAKSNIVKHQSSEDFVIHHPSNPRTLSAVKNAKSIKLPYLRSPGAHINGDNLVIDGNIICKTNEVGLKGRHNLENICAAITATWIFTDNTEAIANAIRVFKGLEHRLEPVADVNGVEYFNDSFSTAPLACVAAIKAFKRPVVAIIGGYDKGSTFEDIAKAAIDAKLKHALLIGETAGKIAEEFDKVGFKKYSVSTTKRMEDIVEQASDLADSGDVVVLTPGCASFDMFDSYIDRGNQFKKVVNGLK